MSVSLLTRVRQFSTNRAPEALSSPEDQCVWVISRWCDGGVGKNTTTNSFSHIKTTNPRFWLKQDISHHQETTGTQLNICKTMYLFISKFFEVSLFISPCTFVNYSWRITANQPTLSENQFLCCPLNGMARAETYYPRQAICRTYFTR